MTARQIGLAKRSKTALQGICLPRVFPPDSGARQKAHEEVPMQRPARAGEPWQQPGRRAWQRLRRRLAALAAVVVTVAGSELMAQSTTSNIQGTVRDETGVLPGATVTARDTQSGFQHTALTSDTGAFALATGRSRRGSR
jgi:hypothetical protein